MRARVSELESFRRFLADDEAELDAFIAQLRNETQPSERMLAGTAFHRALELAEPGEFDRLEAMGHVFYFEADIAIALPTIREIRADKTYRVDGGEITVSGQVDCTEGRRVDDHKTTGQMDVEGYWAGYQWRFYLEIFGADTFRWNVFEVAPASDRFLRELPSIPEGIVYVVRSAHSLEQRRYPGMADDCRRLAEDFYRFARQHLPERFELAAVA